jgi:DNA-binding protein Fis
MKLRERKSPGDTDDARETSALVGLKLKMLNDLAATFQNEVHSLGDYLQTPSLSGQKVEFDPKLGINLVEEVRRLEIELISYALKCTHGHQREAARLLGLKATTLHAKLKHYRIAAKNVERPHEDASRQEEALPENEREDERFSPRPLRTITEGAYQEIATGAI